MPPKSTPQNWPTGSSALSNRTHPGIDDQIGASDKAALVRCEEERGIGHFTGPAHPTERITEMKLPRIRSAPSFVAA